MIKRSPQEIADFFGCYVAQDQAGSWFLYQDKPILINENVSTEFWAAYEISILLNEKLIDVPVNHHWRCLYEPRTQKPDHASEVFIHKEYVVAEGNRIQDLSKKVNTLLSHGWKLQGGVAIEHFPESDGYAEGSAVFYQAMVRGI